MPVSKLTVGWTYLAGYRRRDADSLDTNMFVCFKVGDLVYSNLKLLKQAFGVKNLRDLETEVDLLELGSITAEWYNTEEGYFWGAYLWKGAFRVGTSGDRFVCKAVEEVA